MRWNCAGAFLPLRKRRTASATVEFQRQYVPNTGASSTACVEHVADRIAREVARDLVEREAVHRAERDHDRVLERRGLELEVESAAEALAQRESPRAVHARAERRVDHEMRVAGLVEEPLEDHALRPSAARRARPSPRRDTRRAARPPIDRARASRCSHATAPRASASSSSSASIVVQARRPNSTARPCGRAPRRARTESSAARRARP